MLLKKLCFVFVVGLMMTFSVNAQDAPPRDVRDLVGARASSGETQLRRRGYSFVKTEDGSDRKWSNWWKQSTSTCITVVTMNGRYDSIVTSPDFDCNRNSNSGGGVPNWAIGTFYGRNPQDGSTITLIIPRNGSVSIRFQNGTTEYATINGQQMNHNGIISRISKLNNGIRTTRVDNRERIDYFTNYNGGGNDNNNDYGDRVTPPSWAQGTFYGTGPNGEQITLTINRNGSANAVISGTRYSGAFTRGNFLNIAGGRSRVTNERRGIATTRIDNGERIEYSRSGFGSGSGGGGNKVDVSDLEGVRASSGESQMRARGFRNVDSFRSGNTSYTIWWRARSSQCIQVATANGRYDSVKDIGYHAKCN